MGIASPCGYLPVRMGQTGRALRAPGLRKAILSALTLALAATQAPAAEPPFRPSVPVTDVQSPAAMAALEQKGFGLAALLATREAATLRDLHAASGAYRTLADTIADDVRALR